MLIFVPKNELVFLNQNSKKISLKSKKLFLHKLINVTR